VVKGEQNVLWSDESQHWSERTEEGGVGVGSVFRGLGVRKFWVTGRTLLVINYVKERLKTKRGFERGDLALEMTEDALRDASTHARR